jgi:hypothetical protein
LPAEITDWAAAVAVSHPCLTNSVADLMQVGTPAAKLNLSVIALPDTTPDTSTEGPPPDAPNRGRSHKRNSGSNSRSRYTVDVSPRAGRFRYTVDVSPCAGRGKPRPLKSLLCSLP